MIQSANPLKQYFRQPAIYIKLPSNGQFWPAGAVDIPDSGELPVFPMTAIDEITYRTPDALFNGQAVVNVIQSCMPNIKDAWGCPSSDVNTILTAIRIASYGHTMEMTTTCPHCSAQGDYGLDLRSVIEKISSPDYNKQVNYGDLEIYFKPMSYQEQNSTSQMQFEEQKILQALPDPDLDEQTKLKLLNEVMKKITALTVEVIRWSIASIKTPQAIVTDQTHIKEFLQNCDRQLFNAIRDHIIELRKSTDLQPIVVKCQECHKDYLQPLTLDMASFFEHAS